MGMEGDQRVQILSFLLKIGSDPIPLVPVIEARQIWGGMW